MQDIFIEFDCFIINKSHVILATHDHEHNTITLEVKYGDTTRPVTMQYKDDYDCKEAMGKLSINLDAYTLDHWKTSFIKQMFFARENVRLLEIEMGSVKRELSLLRKELKKNRLIGKL